MKKIRFQIYIAIIFVLLSTLACEASVSTANISNAYLTANSDGSGNTNNFSNDQTFYCIVEVSNAPDDTTLKAAWIAVDVEGVDSNMLIDEVELTTDGQSFFTFDLQNDNLWPSGKYKVEIYLNGQLDKTLEFEVE